MSLQPNNSFLVIFIFIFIASADQTNITAQPGQDARLPCTSPDNKPALFVEWRRTDLRSEYVLRYRNNKINTENQHPSFRDRVDLLDQQMKGGDVSLVLRNVTTGDRGAYKCRVVQTDRKTDTVFTINLDVETSPGGPDGENRGGSGLVVYVVVGLLALVIIIIAASVAACFIHKKDKSQNSNQSSEKPPQSQQPLTDQNQPDEQ
ncbi:uncharacterized protein LOC103153754 [Poecilia formosa]|uniref:uncharacterized protein LOC103153754 n=1 Tax=Poecilia formosa TaxID=48698 RepID=UPI0004448FB5|nr:PREDICTED: uncharacterized protein LOC103153754 [Poecilia formosa]